MTASWILQGLLAAAFLGAGGMKLLKTREDLLANGQKMAWVEDFTSEQLRLIGAVEVLGAVGVIVPALTGIFPILTPIAAAGLALTMLGAAATHLRRREYRAIVSQVILGGMAIGVIMLRM